MSYNNMRNVNGGNTALVDPVNPLNSNNLMRVHNPDTNEKLSSGRNSLERFSSGGVVQDRNLRAIDIEGAQPRTWVK